MEIVKKYINKHFTPVATKKTYIVLHWSTTKTLQQIYDTFMGGRKASAHYGIGEDGTIWQFVPDKFIAWHASEANKFSIGIEHCGGYLLPDGTMAKPTQACHDASAELVKYLGEKHGIKITNEFVKPHSYYDATQCCGSLDINYIISKANMNDYAKKLEEALNWNDAILSKGLATEEVKMTTGDNKPSKLMNVVDDKYKEELIIRLKELNDWLQTTPLKNTSQLDLIVKRYALYVARSLSV